MEKLKRNRFCRISSILGFLFIITFILLSPALINGQSFDSSSLEADNIVRQVLNSNTEFENHTVYLCLWLLNTYNFEYTKGNYIFDMVVSFFWLDPNISTSNWYFTNGYSYPNSEAKILLGKNVTGDVKYEVYRVTAALNTPPKCQRLSI